MSQERVGDEQLAATVAASSISEVLWVADGEPQVRGAVTLWRDGRPTLAFTYADARVAREVAASPRVGVALTEERGTGHAFRPLIVSGRPRLLEDPEGDLFSADLMEQELRRFPPARLLADSPLLRREHWWFLPRLVVEVDVDETAVCAPRTDARDHLLVTLDVAGAVTAQPAGNASRSDDVLVLDVERGAEPGPGTTVPAVLFGQDASFPDLERWAQWSYRGGWDGERFTVADSPTRTGLAPTPGLLARWRRQRALERACRQALAAT